MTLLDRRAPYIYLVEAELEPDADVEGWNRWYDETHVPELLTVPGFENATRFEDRADPRRFLAAYRLSRPDPFSEARYAEVTGWGDWGSMVRQWDRGVFARHEQTQWGSER